MAPGPHLLIDASQGMADITCTTSLSRYRRGGNPSSQELSTRLFTGPYYMPTDKPQNRYQAKGNITYIFGAHQLKLGPTLFRRRRYSGACRQGQRRLPASV